MDGALFINPGAPFTLTLAGEVLQGANENPLQVGRSLKGSRTPVTGLLNFPAVDGDLIETWDQATPGYVQHEYAAGLGWDVTPKVRVGEGFWLYTATARTWLQNVSLTPPPDSAATTNKWIGGSGDWNTATNWSTGTVPSTNDIVVIGPGPGITVTHSSGTHTVKSLQTQQPFALSGGSLTVSSVLLSTNAFTLSGGTLRTASVVATNEASLVVNNGTLDGVTVNGVLDVGKTYAGALLVVTNGLTLNGTCYVGNLADNSRGRMSFVGSQTFEVTGRWYSIVVTMATA